MNQDSNTDSISKLKQQFANLCPNNSLPLPGDPRPLTISRLESIISTLKLPTIPKFDGTSGDTPIVDISMFQEWSLVYQLIQVELSKFDVIKRQLSVQIQGQILDFEHNRQKNDDDIRFKHDTLKIMQQEHENKVLEDRLELQREKELMQLEHNQALLKLDQQKVQQIVEIERLQKENQDTYELQLKSISDAKDEFQKYQQIYSSSFLFNQSITDSRSFEEYELQPFIPAIDLIFRAHNMENQQFDDTSKAGLDKKTTPNPSPSPSSIPNQIQSYDGPFLAAYTNIANTLIDHREAQVKIFAQGYKDCFRRLKNATKKFQIDRDNTTRELNKKIQSHKINSIASENKIKGLLDTATELYTQFNQEFHTFQAHRLGCCLKCRTSPLIANGLADQVKNALADVSTACIDHLNMTGSTTTPTTPLTKKTPTTPATATSSFSTFSTFLPTAPTTPSLFSSSTTFPSTTPTTAKTSSFTLSTTFASYTTPTTNNNNKTTNHFSSSGTNFSTDSKSFTAAPTTPFGPSTNTTPFGPSTNTTPFGPSTNTTPFGPSTNTTPFGPSTNTTPFGPSTNTTPFGPSTNTNPFGSPTNTNPFGPSTNTNPFGSPTNTNPFGPSTNTNPFGSTFGAPNTPRP